MITWKNTEIEWPKNYVWILVVKLEQGKNVVYPFYVEHENFPDADILYWAYLPEFKEFNYEKIKADNLVTQQRVLIFLLHEAGNKLRKLRHAIDTLYRATIIDTGLKGYVLAAENDLIEVEKLVKKHFSNE